MGTEDGREYLAQSAFIFDVFTGDEKFNDSGL